MAIRSNWTKGRPPSYSPRRTDPTRPARPPPEQPAIDTLQIAHWRQSERNRLRTDRLKLRGHRREAITHSTTAHLERRLAGTDLARRSIGACWTIKGEPDFHPWLMSPRDRGAVPTLSAYDRPSQPLCFRRWQPAQDTERSIRNIPAPRRCG